MRALRCWVRGLSVKRRSIGFISCIASRFRWGWRFCWRSISGGFAKTAASAARCKGLAGVPDATETLTRVSAPSDGRSDTPMHGSEADFLTGISPFLGGYYLVLAAMNGFMAFHLWHHKHRNGEAIVWTGVSMLMVIVAAAAMGGSPPGLP